MGVAHLYKDFGASRLPRVFEGDEPSDLQQEEAKLASFEEGYKSGWDDAVVAQSESKSAVGAEFGRNLQAASFAYHEARAGLARELKQFFEPMFESLLPIIAKETLASHLTDQISELASQALDQPLEIAVSPGQMVVLQDLCEENLSQPFTIVPDETLANDQVFLRIGTQEREIEFETWIENIQGLVRAFFEQLDKEKPNA